MSRLYYGLYDFVWVNILAFTLYELYRFYLFLNTTIEVCATPRNMSFCPHSTVHPIKWLQICTVSLPFKNILNLFSAPILVVTQMFYETRQHEGAGLSILPLFITYAYLVSISFVRSVWTLRRKAIIVNRNRCFVVNADLAPSHDTDTWCGYHRVKRSP